MLLFVNVAIAHPGHAETATASHSFLETLTHNSPLLLIALVAVAIAAWRILFSDK